MSFLSLERDRKGSQRNQPRCFFMNFNGTVREDSWINSSVNWKHSPFFPPKHFFPPQARWDRSSLYVTLWTSTVFPEFPTIDQPHYLELWRATVWHKTHGRMCQVQTERVNGHFPFDVRSGFGWISPPLLIVFKARPALMAWPGRLRSCRLGWWLPAHGKAFSCSPLCATAAKVSGRSEGSGSVMGNAWPAQKWNDQGGEGCRVSRKSWIGRRWGLSGSHPIRPRVSIRCLFELTFCFCVYYIHGWDVSVAGQGGLNYQIFSGGRHFLFFPPTFSSSLISNQTKALLASKCQMWFLFLVALFLCWSSKT